MNIKEFNQELVSLENRIIRKNDDAIWHSLWLDMVGIAYSLYRLQHLPVGETLRKNSEIVGHAKEVLVLIADNKEIKEFEHNAWFNGFWFNNADFRISLALHCLLKLCYPCNREHMKDGVGVPALINKICINKRIRNLAYKRECGGKDENGNECKEEPIHLTEKCTLIFHDFFNYYDMRRKLNSEPRPNNTGHYLFEVHNRVNALKHTPNPEEDFLPPNIRIEEIWRSLLGIYELFASIAEKRGALKAAY